jgi:hypothetical protein
LAEWGCSRVVVEASGQTGAQQAIVEADKEQGGSEPGIGDAVTVAARDAFDHACMTEALDFEQAAVGSKADLAQLGEVDQALADAEVVVLLMVVSVRNARSSL